MSVVGRGVSVCANGASGAVSVCGRKTRILCLSGSSSISIPSPSSSVLLLLLSSEDCSS